jgi:NTE family protein
MENHADRHAALVLSGGGAKGAFQVGAERYLRGVKKYKWDVISGVSVGALNGSMLAMGKHQRLHDVWYNITRDKVYTGKLNLWSILKMAFGAKSIYDNGPLWKMIEVELDASKITVGLRVGAVSLETGAYKPFHIDPSTSTRVNQAVFRKAILASTAIPIVWEPVAVSAADRSMVDGGVRNMSPIGDVLDTEPEEIVIITCASTTRPVFDHEIANKNALDIGKHSLEIAMNEIFISDFNQFLLINHVVRQAKDANLAIPKQVNPAAGQKDVGKVYKEYNHTLIEPAPDFPMCGVLEFSPENARRLMNHGWERAKEALG